MRLRGVVLAWAVAWAQVRARIQRPSIQRPSHSLPANQPTNKPNITKPTDLRRPGDITWHENNWGDAESRFLAFTLHDRVGGNDLYAAFNSHGFQVRLHEWSGMWGGRC